MRIFVYCMVLGVLTGGYVRSQSPPPPKATSIDVPSQARNFDLTGADSTRPFKLGTTLPATCAVGEMFFKSNAPGGSNLYGCASANTWILEASGGGGAGTVTVNNGSTPVGSQATLAFLTGAGLINSLSDTGTQINIQQSIDSSVVQTKAAAQAGGALLCTSSGGSATAYTCSMTPTLAAYTVGQKLEWAVDTTCGTAPTLNIDTLGAKPIYRSDGVSLPVANDCKAGMYLPVVYDGSAFRIQGLSFGNLTQTSLDWPYGTCNSAGGTLAAQWTISSATGGTPSCTGTNADVLTVAFSQTTAQTIIKRFRFPANWDSSQPVTLKVSSWHTAGGTGNEAFQAAVGCTGSTMPNVAYNASASSGAVSMPTDSTPFTVTITSLDTTGCTPGALAALSLTRDVTVASNYANPVLTAEPQLLLGVK